MDANKRVLSNMRYFASVGIFVFPLREGTKGGEGNYYGVKWGSEATVDQGIILDWFTRWPNLNYGIACGPSNLVVIDQDIKHPPVNGVENWKKFGFDETEAWIQRTTSGGIHNVYRYDLGDIHNSTKLGPGIDVRGNGGYIVGPGSVVDGKEYVALNEWKGAPGYLPDALAEVLRKPAAMPVVTPVAMPLYDSRRVTEPFSSDIESRVAYWRDKYLEGAHNGNRNDNGKNCALQLRDDGVPIKRALACDFPERAPQDGSPYTRREWEATVNSIYSSPPREPAKKPDNGHNPTSDSNSTHKKPRARSREYLKVLHDGGYEFALCELDDRVYVNGKPISDVMQSEIRAFIRDIRDDYTYGVDAAEDVYITEAKNNSFNPIKEFIEEVTWDGEDHIGRMGSYITDRDGNFPLFFRRWIVGAVARVYEGGKQNTVIVLSGNQGIGKSSWITWLGTGLDGYTREGQIHPDDKDNMLARTKTLIWEVGELGATTSRANVEALKGFISATRSAVRGAYGHYEIDKPNMVSFIATVNNNGGFYNDPTGSRRFMTVEVQKIDWAYKGEIDPRQLWAQAKALYDGGERGDLTPDERKMASAINDQYKRIVPVGEYLSDIIRFDEGYGLVVKDILNALANIKAIGKINNQTANDIATWMTDNGIERFTDTYYYDAVNLNTGEMSRKRGSGYLGVRLEYERYDELAGMNVVERVGIKREDIKLKD